jgi:hypothetical protein
MVRACFAGKRIHNFFQAEAELMKTHRTIRPNLKPSSITLSGSYDCSKKYREVNPHNFFRAELGELIESVKNKPIIYGIIGHMTVGTIRLGEYAKGSGERSSLRRLRFTTSWYAVDGYRLPTQHLSGSLLTQPERKKNCPLWRRSKINSCQTQLGITPRLIHVIFCPLNSVFLMEIKFI